MTLIQQLGGFIACASTSGVGTVFHVGIPVEIRQDEDGVSSDMEEEEQQDEGIPVCGPILVVDDNKINVRILKKTLTLELERANLGIEVITADGGEAAISLYKERLPSVVIIDYHMPGIDGVGATKAIRKYEADHSMVPAYIMSYTADMSDESHALLIACGSNDIMAKPPPKGFVATLVRRFQVVSTKNSVLDHLKWRSSSQETKESDKQDTGSTHDSVKQASSERVAVPAEKETTKQTVGGNSSLFEQTEAPAKTSSIPAVTVDKQIKEKSGCASEFETPVAVGGASVKPASPIDPAVAPVSVGEHKQHDDAPVESSVQALVRETAQETIHQVESNSRRRRSATTTTTQKGMGRRKGPTIVEPALDHTMSETLFDSDSERVVEARPSPHRVVQYPSFFLAYPNHMI